MGRRVSWDTLLVRWDEHEADFKVWFPNKCDGGLVLNHLVGNACSIGSEYFEDTFVDELEKRGYDPTTLRFTIKKKNETTIQDEGQSNQT